MPCLLFKLVQEQSGWISLALCLLVSYHFDDLCGKTGTSLEIIYCLLFQNLICQVTQSYLPRVVKPTPQPQEKKKSQNGSAKEIKSQ